MSFNHFVAFLFRTWGYFLSMLPRRDVAFRMSDSGARAGLYKPQCCLWHFGTSEEAGENLTTSLVFHHALAHWVGRIAQNFDQKLVRHAGKWQFDRRPNLYRFGAPIRRITARPRHAAAAVRAAVERKETALPSNANA